MIVKVLTWNINQRANAGGKRKIPDFVADEIIYMQRADIVVLTEFSVSAENIDEFIEKLETQYDVFCSNHNLHNVNEVLIATKKTGNIKITQPTKNSLTDGPNFLQVDMENEGRKLTIIGTRIRIRKGNSDEDLKNRANQLKVLCDYLRDHINEETSVLIMGDFNIDQKNFKTKNVDWKYKNKAFNEIGYTFYTPEHEDAFSHLAFGRHKKKSDHIMANRLLKVRNMQYSWDYMRYDTEIYENGKCFKPPISYPDHAILTADIDFSDTEKKEKLNSALTAVGDILSEAAREIVGEMESRNEFKSDSGQQIFAIRRGNMGTFSRGILTPVFDFRNYIWITIKDVSDDKRRWMVTLNYNDIDNDNDFDKNSGNPHTQFGKIQFWEGINIKEGCCSSPHELISKDGSDIVLRFCGNKSYDPKQSICNGTYNPKILVDEFIKRFGVNAG